MLLESYCLPHCYSFAVSDPFFANLDISHSVLFVVFLFTMRLHVYPPYVPLSRVPRAHLLDLAHRALVLSFTRSVSATLSLNAFILIFSVKVLSMIFLIRSRHLLLCGLIAHPCDPVLHKLDNLLCDRKPRCQQTTRETFLAQP